MSHHMLPSLGAEGVEEYHDDHREHQHHAVVVAMISGCKYDGRHRQEGGEELKAGRMEVPE